VGHGFELAFLMDMDWGSFQALLESVKRVDSATTVRQAWISMCAAQGTYEGMKAQLAEAMKALEQGQQQRDDFDRLRKQKQ
jgi:hypothetical protein